jgi:hypothetical protein
LQQQDGDLDLSVGSDRGAKKDTKHCNTQKIKQSKGVAKIEIEISPSKRRKTHLLLHKDSG